jgi:hypothetical protein
MTDKPKITSLQPMVLADNRRVTFEMVVDNLPDMSPHVFFTMPDMSGMPDMSNTPPTPPKSDPDTSPYPDIELSILDNQRQPVANLFIVEHKERRTSLTLHLPAPDSQEQYTARAEITHQEQTLDVVEVPFRLNLMDSIDE